MPEPNPPAPDDLLLAGEVARMAGVTPALVRVWAKTDRLPYLRLPSGVRLYRRGDVEHHIADREQFGPRAGRCR